MIYCFLKIQNIEKYFVLNKKKTQLEQVLEQQKNQKAELLVKKNELMSFVRLEKIAKRNKLTFQPKITFVEITP